MLGEFAGIYVLDQKIKSDNQINDLNRKVNNLRNEQSEKEAIRRVNDNFTEQELQRARDYIQAAKDSKISLVRENKRLEDENNFNKKLIASNPATVADYSPEFKKEYMRERDMLSEWMLSQKGFKDIANKFGEKLGFNEQEVRKMAMASGIDIITKEAREYEAKGEQQGDYAQYNKERIERVKISITEKYLK